MRRLILLAVVVVAGAAAGCGSPTPPAAATDANRATLEEVSALLKLPTEQGRAAPHRAEDLRLFENAYPTGYEAVRSGQVVVAWNGATGGPGSVLAYEKAVPTTGGLVLLHDGTIKPMTPDEFKVTPKGK